MRGEGLFVKLVMFYHLGGLADLVYRAGNRPFVGLLKFIPNSRSAAE